jgi:hypothetical protein
MDNEVDEKPLQETRFLGVSRIWRVKTDSEDAGDDDVALPGGPSVYAVPLVVIIIYYAGQCCFSLDTKRGAFWGSDATMGAFSYINAEG